MPSHERACSCCSTIPRARLRFKKEPKIPTDFVVAAKPLNAESEREKFFDGEEENYEPQFAYRLPPPLLEKALRRYSLTAQVERRYVPHAMRVLTTLLTKYGSYAAYQEQHGGEALTEAEARPIVDEYIGRLGFQDELTVVFDPALVARASFVKKSCTLKIRSQGLRKNWIQGMLHHEVGTHFLRDRNDKMQPWAREKGGRKKYRLEDKNPTEEGLASLHTVLEREGHCLWRAALLYYATWRALQLSFRDLYEDLAQFLGDNEDERWDFCVRAKRGLLDTSQPGGFAKDQTYMVGAMEILENRRKIDFNALYAGKISVIDAHRARSTGLAKVEKLALPWFLQGKGGMERYMSLLDEIVRDNGLTDLVDGGRQGSTTSTSSSGNGSRRLDRSLSNAAVSNAVVSNAAASTSEHTSTSLSTAAATPPPPAPPPMPPVEARQLREQLVSCIPVEARQLRERGSSLNATISSSAPATASSPLPTPSPLQASPVQGPGSASPKVTALSCTSVFGQSHHLVKVTVPGQNHGQLNATLPASLPSIVGRGLGSS